MCRVLCLKIHPDLPRGIRQSLPHSGLIGVLGDPADCLLWVGGEDLAVGGKNPSPTGWWMDLRAGKLDCNKIQKYDPQGTVNLSWKCSRPFKMSPRWGLNNEVIHGYKDVAPMGLFMDANLAL